MSVAAVILLIAINAAPDAATKVPMAAAAAIADDPQIAVPMLINHPAEAGQLKRFTKIFVTSNTTVMLDKIPRIGIQPILTKNR